MPTIRAARIKALSVNAFTENGAPVPIADVDTSITDADSSTLVSATIKLVNPQAGDLLTVSGALPGRITTAGYDPGTGVLTLTGVGTLAEYETALEADSLQQHQRRSRSRETASSRSWSTTGRTTAILAAAV